MLPHLVSDDALASHIAELKAAKEAVARAWSHCGTADIGQVVEAIDDLLSRAYDEKLRRHQPQGEGGRGYQGGGGGGREGRKAQGGHGGGP